MPKASGKVLGITCASQADSRAGKSPCSIPLGQKIETVERIRRSFVRRCAAI
jgi:hypothetical protein